MKSLLVFLLVVFICEAIEIKPPSVFIDDTRTSVSAVWSSDKVNTVTAAIISSAISDTTVSTTTLWSSSKINDVTSVIISNAISDTTVSTTTLWSSSKIDSVTDTMMPDEVKTYYVGKHGSDSNDCKTLGAACLTFGQAMSLAISEGPPSATTPVSIVCFDSGIYTVTSTLEVTSYATIYAQSANIVGAVSQNDFSSITIGKISTTTGIALARVTGGSDISSAFICEVDTTGGTLAIGILNTISASDMFVSVDKLRVGTSGFGVGHVGSADGHLHVKINDIELLGNSATGMAVANAASEIMANVGTIQDKGFTGTTGLNVINGEIHINVLEMDADTAYTIGASGYLTLNTHQFSGTETNSGQLEMIAMNNGWKGSYSIESTGTTTFSTSSVDFSYVASHTPTNSAEVCVPGRIAHDDGYVYACTSAAVWGRTTITTGW